MSENQTILGVIPARGGSRRVPRKNIKELNGKPLIAYSIEAAKQSKLLDYFLVSTNDKEIAEISKKYGAHVPFKRPAKLSEDVDTSLVAAHAIQKYEEKKQKNVGFVCILQPTSPFRTASDIDECIRIAKTTNVDSVVSFTKVSQFPQWCFEMKPYSHEMTPYMSDIRLEGENLVSQNLPILFYPNGAIYVVKRDVILEGRIFGDKIYGYLMPPERSIDLEEEYDFLVASALAPHLEDVWVKISWVIS